MYVGVDVGKRRCRAAVVDGDDVLVDEFSFSNDFDRYGFRREFSDLFGKAGLEWLKRLELKPLDRLLLDSYHPNFSVIKTPVVIYAF